MKNAILKELAEAVLNLDPDIGRKVAEKAVKAGIDPLESIEKGLNKGLREVGDRYERDEFFIPELAMAAEVVKASMEILEPEMRKSKKRRKTLGRYLIGTVAGDVHDIGKTIVKMMLEIHGFEVIDLGKDVPTSTFVKRVRELRPDIVGASALLSITALHQRDLIEALKTAGLRDKVKVMIGGGAASEEWAREIGADAYAQDSIEAVKEAKRLLSINQK